VGRSKNTDEKKQRKKRGTGGTRITQEKKGRGFKVFSSKKETLGKEEFNIRTDFRVKRKGVNSTQ